MSIEIRRLAREATPVYLAYYRTGTIPDGYSLRLLDLS
jgi:hypothetical protein